jgi:thioester reductase-like protein
LTLITGKKFDPAPLEAAMATSPYLDDVLIFGNSRPFPGALLLRSKEFSKLSDNELLEAIKPAVEKLNSESQDHARIPFHMLVPMPHQEPPLEKSSKGTIIRRVAESRFEDVIDQSYTSQGSDEGADVQDKDVPKYLMNMVQSVTSQSHALDENIDLFSYGVDSIACMQLRTRLMRLVPNIQKDLPMSVIEDCGTIRRLVEYVLRKRHGDPDASEEDEEKLMVDLVKQYSSFTEPPSTTQIDHSANTKGGETVVLTGVTGALGAHVLDLLQNSSNVYTIYCLVRGASDHAARERVNKALQQRGLTSPPSPNTPTQKVVVLQAQLSDPHLGLTSDLYNKIAQHATSIVHIAWTVNFRLKLRSFEKDNIAGVTNLMNLALSAPRTTPPRFTYCSSTASIINNRIYPLPERILPDPSTANPLGYSRSKWVAEHICAAAHNRTKLRGRIAVVRVGQLAGDSVSGVWNTKEAWPIMLSTAGVVGCLPNLRGEVLDWLPVDVAARAFVQATGLGERSDGTENEEQDLPVYHVLNPHTGPTWQQMLDWLKKKQNFETVEPQEWVRKLEKCEQEHSSLKLLGLWKEAYGAKKNEEMKRPQFDLTETKKIIDVMRNVEPLDEGYVGRIWDWIQANVH